MLSRKLEPYELICAGSNINFMLAFESALALKKEHLIEAFRNVAQKHPYYRTSLFKLDDGSYEFRQKENKKENGEQFQFVEQFFYDYAEELDDWRTYLIQIGSKKRDLNKSMIYFEIRSFENQYQLFGSINHAGFDGPGVFTSIKDLCHYLDKILSNIHDEKIESRAFHNIHKNYKKLDLEKLIKENDLIDNFIDGFKPFGTICNSESLKPFITSEFYQLDEKLTRTLIENCKKEHTTVQGVLSAALAISLWNEKSTKSSKNETIRIVNSCPCNMRSNFGLTNDDLVCGSAALIWLDVINESDSIWNMAKKTTRSIKQKLEENYGYKWWVRLKNGLPVQNYSLMGSSMGVVSLDERKMKNLKIKDLRFLGSCYELPREAINCMTHAFTFLDRFTFNISYTFPSLSKEWVENFGNNVEIILQYFATNESTKDQTTLAELSTKLHKFESP